jgi:hypothetical protein
MCDKNCVKHECEMCECGEPKHTTMEIMRACMKCGVDWKDCGASTDCPRLKKILKEMTGF